ncbi:MAG TPA: hypothetical protein VG206_20685 [Terriglobia bacterium]|nr:hypothetical protein [Terriglobia bacterium]
MTSQEAAEHVQAELGPLWPRDRPVPKELLAPLCEALWQEGINPNRRIVQQRLPAVNDHAVGPGVVAWRRTKGLPEQGLRSPHPLPTNLEELTKIVSLPIAKAPFTCFDPSNDGRWLTPPLKVLRYLGRIENRSVRDAMALIAILRADRLPRSLYCLISNFTYILRRLMNEQRIEDVTAINPDHLLFRVYAGEAGQGLTDDQRQTLISQWNVIRNAFEEYAEILHQRDKTVTQYYARPTATQVLNAAEMMFVDRIDVGAEALRSPEEIGRMLKEAEEKLGALTEVFGGTCVVANMCPAKFACVGCAGNAPDPGKRYQIEQKKAWAEQQLRYAIREKLAGEERTLKQLFADCKLMTQEMDLIEAARADQVQPVNVRHGATKG